MTRTAPALFLACLIIGAAAYAAPEPGDDSQGTTVSETIHLNGPVDTVFSLFDPLRRSRWEASWDITALSPADAETAVEGMTFKRTDDPLTTWIVTTFDPDGHVLVYRYGKPDLYTITMRIRCETDGDGTRATVTCTGTGHSPAVQKSLAGQLRNHFSETVTGEDGWDRKINHYLARGTALAPWTPLALEREHAFRLPAPPDAVFPLLNPADGNHWTPGTPDYVFGSATEPVGAMWRRKDSWMAVTEFDPEARVMRSVLFMPATEFLIETVRCDADGNGGTRVAVTWRVAGLSDAGNTAVQEFFDTFWDTRMEMIQKTYAARLAGTGG